MAQTRGVSADRLSDQSADFGDFQALVDKVLSGAGQMTDKQLNQAIKDTGLGNTKGARFQRTFNDLQALNKMAPQVTEGSNPTAAVRDKVDQLKKDAIQTATGTSMGQDANPSYYGKGTTQGTDPTQSIGKVPTWNDKFDEAKARKTATNLAPGGSAQVQDIQKHLNRLNEDRNQGEGAPGQALVADGIVGPKTLARAQEAHGQGLIDDKTMDALLKKYGSYTKERPPPVTSGAKNDPPPVAFEGDANRPSTAAKPESKPTSKAAWEAVGEAYSYGAAVGL
jgi:hypothetical protein